MVDDLPAGSTLRPDVLHLILMPTERCNFRCVYCYEDFKIGRMSAATVRGVKQLIRGRIGSLSSLHIGWFGGEPTLAPDIVLDVNRSVQEAMDGGLRFTSSMSTNGWLLDEQRFASFLRAGVTTYQISLDGPPEWHDTTRVTAGGEGSFERIIANVQAATRVDGPFRIALRLHVSEDNCDGMEQLIDELAGIFARDGRIKVYLKEVEPLGSANDASFRFVRRRGAVERLRRQAEDAGMLEQGARSPTCYAALPSSLVIRADGRVAKCTVALNDVRNSIGSIDGEGHISVDSGKLLPWISGIFSGDPQALHCPLSVMDRQSASQAPA